MLSNMEVETTHINVVVNRDLWHRVKKKIIRLGVSREAAMDQALRKWVRENSVEDGGNGR
jgi:post-segregation antitoxin (ccd killing protein)